MKIFIVEGKSDTNRLKRYLGDVLTVETSGLGLNEQIVKKIEKYQQNGDELILFTDPDSAGETIRRKVNELIPDLKQAYLTNNQKSKREKRKVGIEHATDAELKQALGTIYQLKNEEIYTLNDLIDLKLVGDKKRRIYLAERLNLAYGNNQKLIKQLNYFAIEREKIIKILKELDE